MSRLLTCCASAVTTLLLCTGVSRATTIAITEFEVDPAGADGGVNPEWVELFNYGTATVDLSGWTLKDNATSIYTFPAGFSIPSGGYAVAANSRAGFVTKWLGGVDDARVAGGDVPFVMNNTNPGDGLFLRDLNGDLVWSLGYNVANAANDNTAIPGGRATFLAVNDFSITDYGVPPQAGSAFIIRAGNDLVGTNNLGYEDNSATADPFMFAPAPNPNTRGSPLLGHYTVVPEPAAVASLLLVGVTTLARPRRRA